MLKGLLSVITAITILVAPVSVYADSYHGSDYTDVSGTSYDYGRHDGHKHGKITVSCDGHDRNTFTDDHDNYSVKFNKKECKKGSWISVTSDYDGHHKTGHGRSNGEDHCRVDVDNGPSVTEVPEFGTLASIGAGIIGAASFLVIRRRQLRGHSI